jgi:hypothetical protein
MAVQYALSGVAEAGADGEILDLANHQSIEKGALI